MKLRYLYLAIGVLCNASLVSCGDSFKEKTEIVACGISTNALTFGVSSTEVQTVDITSEAAWEVAVDQPRPEVQGRVRSMAESIFLSQRKNLNR